MLSQGKGGIGGLLGRSHGYSAGNWSTHNFYHADGNGNITYLVTSAQGLAASYRYDPYGNTISSSGSLASANVYRFSSNEWHANAGLYYYGYRFYSPNWQRWPNRDPIQEEGGMNLYSFVLNDSIDSHDSIGLQVGTGKGKPPRWDPDPKPWSKGENNCCNYAYDRPAPSTAPPSLQPGESAKMQPPDKWTCAELVKRIRADFKPLDPNLKGPQNGKCPDGYHAIKLWVSPSGGYHLQRQDDDGKWSEKPGFKSDPRRCGPNEPEHPDDIPCGTLCVPNIRF